MVRNVCSKGGQNLRQTPVLAEKGGVTLMAKSYRHLREKMSPQRQKRNESEARKMIVEIALQELRQSLHLTQEELAKMLDIKQASLSKLENQEDMYISTLNRFITALGGKLKLVASFPDREVIISQFDS